MSSGLPGFGGQGYVKQDTRALSSIAETPGADLSQGQEEQIKMLQSHDYQIKFLASQMKQAQKGISDANQNPIQQVEQFIADIIILLGGGELATGALDFGDLQYILPALGAMFGFGDGPFPISLFEAAEKFFLGYVVPNAQFVDVINGIIQAWLGTLGIDPKFIKDIKSLVTAVGDLFDGLENLLPSLNELFNALGISGGDLGPFGQLLGPIIKLFSGLDLKDFGNMIEFITNAIDPFIVQLTAIINWVDSILAVFGFSGSGGVVNSSLGDTTNPFTNLLGFLGNINFASPDFNLIAAAVTFITKILLPTGLIQNVISGISQQIIDALVAGFGGGTATGNNPAAILQALATQALAIAAVPLQAIDAVNAILAQLLGGQTALQNNPAGASQNDDYSTVALTGRRTNVTGTMAIRNGVLQTVQLAADYLGTTGTPRKPLTQKCFTTITLDQVMDGVTRAYLCSDVAMSNYAAVEVYSGFGGDAVRIVVGSSPSLVAVQEEVDLDAGMLAAGTTFEFKYDPDANKYIVLRNLQPIGLEWEDVDNIVTHAGGAAKLFVGAVTNALDRNEIGYYGPGIRKQIFGDWL